MYKNTLFKKALSLLMCLALVLSYLPSGVLRAAAAGEPLTVVSGSKKADPSTLSGWERYFGPQKMDTEFAGAVWTDKSVFSTATEELPGVTLTDSNNFLVALSAIASNLSITGHTSAPTDTMLVLDMSGSMVDGTYEVGRIRQNNRYQTVDGIDMSLITAMIDATNATIDKLMKQNTNNRVGVVLYSGNSSTNQAATPETATVVLPLGRYAGNDGKYLSVDTTWQTRTLYTYRNGQYQAIGTATYVAEGTRVDVSVADGLKTETGGDVTDTSKRANGGTYIQNGLYKAMEQFLAVTDTAVAEGKPQAGAERLPVIVLMTDGAPTIATTSYTNIGDSDTGNGSSTNDRITFLTQLTAAYVRGRVAAKYQENDNDEQDVLFLTLGLGTENSTAATNTLYPAGSNSTLVGYWNTYLGTNAGSNATIISGDDGLQVTRDANVASMNYVNKYFYASDAQDLLNSFNDILSEIELKAESYATLVESSSADFSGYVTFDDELGKMMHVSNVSGILLGDTLFTGQNLANGMTDGNLGTVDGPKPQGDELVRTVKERIPGTTTTQAQQLIDNAHQDQQLFSDGNNWSNYIGWYADENGNYAGFWDKDSGYENAPAGAVYANRSYGYLGVNGDSNMMHVVVMVRTELATLNQTVLFKIPASLLPTVQYKVTLNEDDPSKVEAFVREDALPMRLVFEVGLRDDINSVNLEQKIAEHSLKPNDDGTITFYTNEWVIGNDKNGNGIPDPEEVDTAIVTQSHFHPALDNTRFYYTEDTVILTGNGSPVIGNTRPSDTDNDPSNGTGFYYDRYIYTADGRDVIHTPIAATTLANDAQYDAANSRWYVPAGTMYHDLARFQTGKASNPTDTLSYSFFPAVFDSVSKQDVYTFLGNNGAITIAPATGITLRKQVEGTIENVSSYTFLVTLSNIPSGAVAAPLLTDASGDPLTGVTMSAYANNQFTVTMPANITAYISGIPVGTTVQIAEQISGDYKVSNILVAGQTQSVDAPATAIIPAYTAGGSQMVPVVITNAPNNYGSLVVSKDVNYPEGFLPGDAHNSKTFPIHVTFTGDITGMEVPQGATGNGNTFTLLLKDGQSASFTNIPEGVTYTVTEDGMSSGYAFQELRYSDADRKIDGNDLDEAHVVNKYTLQPVNPNVKIQGSKTLVTNESDWGGETFTVELLRIDNFADEDPVSTGLTATMTQAKPHYEIDLSSIDFTEAGTYYFRAVEVIPENRNENIAYDRSFGLFSITVGDANADGSLEVQDVKAYQTTTVSGGSANGWILEKNFTNVVTTDRIYLDIRKHVVDANTQQPVNAHRGDITFGLFTDMRYDENMVPAYYTLTNTQGQATFMIPVTKEAIQQSSNGQLLYFMREIAPAVENRVVGMDYNEDWMYAISIVWDDTQNQAVVSYAPIENGQIGNYTVYTDGSFTFEQTNTYESNVSANIDLTGKKTLNGSNDLGNRTFSFNLYEATAAFVRGGLIQTVNNNANGISFSNISFTAPGVYYMLARENASTLGGITVDSTEYHITVEVEKYSDSNGTTRLRLVQGYPTVVAYGTSENVGADGLNFNNIYTITGSGEVTIGGKKVLDGKALTAGNFSVGLYSDAACQNLLSPSSVTYNRADGTFSFPTISYTVADLGENNAAKTYTYYVKEILPTGAVLNEETGKYELNGVAYDPTVHTVTVTVSHENGILTVTPSDNAATLQISNAYSAKPVTVDLNGRKDLSGNWDAVSNANKSFTFQLFRADSSFAITSQTAVATASVIGSDDFNIALTYGDGQEGLYYYVLKENTSAQAGGIGYDAGEYHITVNVSDPGNGHLAAQTTMYRPGTGNSKIAIFTNRYTVEPTSITLEGKKSYINSVTQDPMDMDEGMFSFLVLEGNDLENAALAATGYNLANGDIQFTPIRYTTAGVHTYSVVEVSGDAGGVNYDNTVFTVTVTVTDNGNGTLTAAADYHNTPVNFENTYTHQAAQVTFNGEKFLDGDWSAVSTANKTFTFELYETGSAFTISGEPKDVVTDGAGAFSFGTLSYATEGAHYYVIRERSGDPNKGITYSNAEYHITVVVDDDGNGKLIPTVTATESNVTITADAQNVCLATVDDLDFTNSYEAKPAQYTPEAKKLYERDDTVQMEQFDFVLTVSGNPKQTKQNDTEGKVLFDTLFFETAGIYELKIREQKDLLLGLIRWDVNVYTITLHVEDDGAGQLFVNENMTVITSEKGRTDLIFRNAHHDVIVNKDVFLPAAPKISIDGKKVEKGEILLYKVSYTNYDSVPVDIEITDTIPQHTTYEDNSADKGGILTGNTLRWTLADVQPDETVTVSFRVKVTGSNITVVNEATILEGENEYHTNAVRNPVDEIVKDVFLGSASSSIDGRKVNKGDILTYKITYNNAGDEAAQVTITDSIPAHTTYKDGTANYNGVYAGGKLTWNLTVDAGQSVTVSFQVEVIESKVIIVNYATGFDGINEFDTNVVTNPVDEIVKDVFHADDLTTRIDGKEVEKNDILHYTITYTNTDDEAAQVTITDTIPAHTSYVANSADNGGVYASGKLTWTLQLAAGESKTVSFQVKVEATKITVVNQAFGESDGNSYETNIVRNPVDEDILVKNVFADPALTTKIDGKKVEKGDILYYAITYTNADDLAGTVTITDTIPEHTTYVENSADNGGVYTSGKLIWTLQLAAGESKTVSFQVEVNGSNVTVVNQAHAEEGENKLDSNIIGNPAVEDTIVKDVFRVNAPTVSIDGKKVEKDSILLYKLTYTNSDDAAAEVTITDAIPQHTTYVTGSADNGGIYADGALVWSLQLAAGESKTVSFQVKVVDSNVTVVNKAAAEDGQNKLESNQVTNTVPAPSDIPQTGDDMNLALWGSLMLLSAVCLFVLVISRKRLTT